MNKNMDKNQSSVQQKNCDNVVSCENCPESAMEYEVTIGGYYCQSCGVVKEASYVQDTFVAESHFVPTTSAGIKLNMKNVPFTIHREGTIKISHGKELCLQKVNVIGSRYGIGDDGKDKINSMFNLVYPEIKCKSNKFKMAVVGCLIYKIITESNSVVLLPEFLKIMDCPRKLFFKARKCVEGKFGKVNSVPSSSSSSELIRTVLKYGTREALLSGQEFEKFVHDTNKILDFAQKCWLQTGRSVIALIIACAFFAYKTHLIRSNDVKGHQLKLNQFCDLFHITDHRYTANLRMLELRALFRKLAEHKLKSTDIDVTTKDIPLLIDYIIVESPDLIPSYAETHCNSPEQTKASITFKEFRRKRKVPEYPPTFGMTDEEAKHLNSLPDTEIMDDSEMSTYVRSSEEVKKLKEVRTLIKQGKPLLDEDGNSVLYKNLPEYASEGNLK